MLEKSFGYQEPGRDYVTREGAYAVLMDEDGRVGIVEAPAAHGPSMGLFLVGGGIEPGETPEECIRRECLEEIGSTVEIIQELCLGDDYLYAPSTPCWLHVVGHCYLCKLLDKVKESVEKDHTFMWLPWQEAEAAMFLRYQSWAVCLGAEAAEKKEK